MEQEPLQHADTWAVQTFGAAELRDPRRTDRLIKIANALAENPSASLPHDARDLGRNAGGISFLEQPCIRV
ncbi:transposase DNA-binding-containing protein [Ktedonobacter racemifer]|uniref:IS4/Tn5 family transposase DNA-binding protein n=1 Tax=Ktedonobacter racemifer TaxID=363277 RepID=UPI00058D5157|nr:transposase DNA-binding-containing protein [Ktedonobacter racemifer]